MRVAVVGAGISGIGAALTLLEAGVNVTLFERETQIGGHAHSVVLPSGHAVDTSFMVFSPSTYPNLVAFYTRYNIPFRAAGDMSVSVTTADAVSFGFQSLSTYFPTWSSMLDVAKYRLLLDYRACQSSALGFLNQGISDLPFGQWSACTTTRLLDGLLHPLLCSSFSCPVDVVEAFSTRWVLQWLLNHGFLGHPGSLSWFTVAGGVQIVYEQQLRSRLRDCVQLGRTIVSVDDSDDGVLVTDSKGVSMKFDCVVMACHPPDTLAILKGPALSYHASFLTAHSYRPSTCVLHSDATAMPLQR
jgi:predicted NAD/FAD-binding protein